MLAHTTASLTSFAYHKPAKMPKLQKLLGEDGKSSGPSAPARQSLDEMAGVIRGWRILLGGPRQSPPEGQPPDQVHDEEER